MRQDGWENAYFETDYLSVTIVSSSKWSNDNTQKKTLFISFVSYRLTVQLQWNIVFFWECKYMDKDFLGKWGNNKNASLNKNVSSFIWQKFPRLAGKPFLAFLKNNRKYLTCRGNSFHMKKNLPPGLLRFRLFLGRRFF